MSQKTKLVAEAKTTLPTAKSGGDDVDLMADKYGRLITLPYTVRDLVMTAQASVTTGTNTVLATGITGVKLDLVYISFTNSSDAAISVVLADDGTTVRTFTVPVSTTNAGVVTYDWPIPWPQSASGGTWMVDMGDYTNTTITVDALFVKN